MSAVTFARLGTHDAMTRTDVFGRFHTHDAMIAGFCDCFGRRYCRRYNDDGRHRPVDDNVRVPETRRWRALDGRM